MDTMWAVGVVMGLFPLFIWILISFNDWRYSSTSINGGKLPPGHMGWPIIGELISFLWHFKFMGTPDDFIRKRILKFVMGTGTENGSFTAGWPSPRLAGEQSISMVEGEQHKHVRRHLLEAINKPRSLENIFIRLQPAFKDSFENWVVKGEFSAVEEIRSVAFSNICSLLISFHKKPMLENMEKMYRGFLSGMRAFAINIPGTAFHYALQCRKRLDEIMCCEIQDRKSNKGRAKTDFLQELMDSVDSNGNKLSEEEVIDNITSLLLAGYESTALSMIWALYYLFKYPQVLSKLKEENNTIRMHKGENKFLNYDDVKKMIYTRKVIDEVIRLANVASFMFRTVAKDTEFNGYKFPKGWKVIIWLRTIHVDSQYFKDPVEFYPERWEGFHPKPAVNNPFGLGPRQCPGDNLAKMQLLIFLHHICINYKWEFIDPNEGTKFLPNPIPANGAQIKFSHV